MAKKLLVWFEDVDKEDIALVGGKGANLGEMTKVGFPVPPGFIVTSTAYREFIKENNLEIKIRHLLGSLDYNDTKSLEKASRLIKKTIEKGKLSEELIQQIFKAYFSLGGLLKNPFVAVRSSATAEDLPNASFAGQQETFLNVQGEANLIIKVKEVWASLFDQRAIFYRYEQHFDHFNVAIAVPVQKMVEAEQSGIMFSIDPVTNDKSKIIIEGIYGLGEYIVGGKVTPDHYEVDKQSLNITKKQLTVQKIMLTKKDSENKEIKVPTAKQHVQKISDAHIKQLAELSKKLEYHYYFPQDSEWAITDGKVYLVQTRPITTVSAIDKKSEEAHATIHLEVLLTGDPASPGIATGPVKILQSAKDIDKIVPGDVLVADQTNPDFVSAMKRAVAIVTNQGGRTSHAAIVSREIGVPAVVGTQTATHILKDHELITVNGLTGKIYRGGHIGHVDEHYAPTKAFVPTATKVYVNLAEPELAEKVALRQVDGVGLLRAEFMMAGIGTHPKKLIHEGKSHLFVEKMAEGIATFCRTFSPRPVVYRASDFKTNEYRELVGGKAYEPVEPNPMLGYRGAYRYIHNEEVFQLELEAIKMVRNKMGLKNVWLMLPFVRTVDELVSVKKILSANGIYRSPSFKLWMMCEVPSNVILLERYIEEGIDGVSIGSNDLTMLILGTDRDNSDVASVFNEQDPAVLWALEHVIRTCHKYKIPSSLCGQAASVYPSLLEKLVKWGITSISVSPDALDRTREEIARVEKEMISK